jgi:hypothetical protein
LSFLISPPASSEQGSASIKPEVYAVARFCFSKWVHGVRVSFCSTMATEMKVHGNSDKTKKLFIGVTTSPIIII